VYNIFKIRSGLSVRWARPPFKAFS